MTTIGLAEVLGRLDTWTPAASRISIRTGASLNPPSANPQRTYRVEVSADDVALDTEQFG